VTHSDRVGIRFGVRLVLVNGPLFAALHLRPPVPSY
jgi:hypothetical protein